jgi:hypothetical protein
MAIGPEVLIERQIGRLGVDIPETCIRTGERGGLT